LCLSPFRVATRRAYVVVYVAQMSGATERISKSDTVSSHGLARITTRPSIAASGPLTCLRRIPSCSRGQSSMVLGQRVGQNCCQEGTVRIHGCADATVGGRVRLQSRFVRPLAGQSGRSHPLSMLSSEAPGSSTARSNWHRSQHVTSQFDEFHHGR